MPPFEEVARFRCWFWSPAPHARSSAPAQPRAGAGQVVDGSQVPVVVKFFAKWCRKCMAMGPKYKKIAAGYGGRATFVKIEIEEAGHLAKKESGVVAIPTFQVSSRPPTPPPAARASGEWLYTRTCRLPQVWKGRTVTDKYVAGSVISKVPGELCEMIDRNLDCGFSLVSEISEDLKQARPVPRPVPRSQRSQLPSCTLLLLLRSASQRLSSSPRRAGPPRPGKNKTALGGGFRECWSALLGPACALQSAPRVPTVRAARVPSQEAAEAPAKGKIKMEGKVEARAPLPVAACALARCQSRGSGRAGRHGRVRLGRR